ncbi:MAG: FAD:protein FMN transferase [Bacteroides sp.]|nr:FAD:protein FMN transferase [Bacteroides sp.]
MKEIGFFYKNKVLYAWFFSMHTRADILLCGEDEPKLKQIINLIYTELNRLEKMASYFNPSSELSHVNHSADLGSVSVSEELHRMIRVCKEFYHKTDGYFDITIQSDNYNKQTFQKLEVSDECIFFRQKGIKLDLSGFLKGYGLEQIRKILISESVASSLVNLGNSSILALGNHPNGKAWKINLGKEGITNKECSLSNQCLTTSGNENNKPKHIISPYTGQFIESLKKLSVITDSGIEGEVLSTALFAAPACKRDELVKKFNVPYIL